MRAKFVRGKDPKEAMGIGAFKELTDKLQKNADRINSAYDDEWQRTNPEDYAIATWKHENEMGIRLMSLMLRDKMQEVGDTVDTEVAIDNFNRSIRFYDLNEYPELVIYQWRISPDNTYERQYFDTVDRALGNNWKI